MKRILVCMLGLAVVLSGCGSEETTSTAPPGSGGNPNLGPIEIFDIFLRPRAIQRAPEAGGLPNPHLSVHYLTAFFTGGSDKPVFDWQLDPALGDLKPKSEGLPTNEASVSLLNDGNTPLGFYDITVSGTSGGLTSTHTRRFAVIENSWQKHVRAEFDNPQDPPTSLNLTPIFAPSPGGDELFYIEAPSPLAINMRRINAFAPLNEPEQIPGNVFVAPANINGNQALTAAEVFPDLSPPAMGQTELLFSSQLDPDYDTRCPTNTCRNPVPFRIWGVERPSGIIQNEGFPLTEDSTYVFLGNDTWFAFNYFQPRWDPTSTGYPARIAYVTNNRPNPQSPETFDLWLADFVDTNSDNKGDALINHRKLTDLGNVGDFDWHPNGQSLYIAGDPSKIRKVSATTGAIEKEIGFVSQDSLLSTPSWVSVFHRPGEHTLIAFQANSENLTHLYVYDEDDDLLSRVSPFPYPVNTTLFPSWHPTKRGLVYSSDYTVNAWSDAADPEPLINANFERQPRTRFPSIWVMKLED